MRKLERTVLAFICMIAVLLSSTNMLSVVQATTNAEGSSEEFTYITVTDFGLEDENIYNNTLDAWSLSPTPLTNGETLDQKTFWAYVTFPTEGAMITLGAPQDVWYGCRIYLDGSGAIVMTDAGYGKQHIALTQLSDGDFTKQRILIKISVVIQENVVTIRAAVNEFDEQIMTITIGNEDPSFTNCLSAWSNKTDGLKLEAYYEPAPEDLTQLSWKDFGIEENTSCTHLDDGNVMPLHTIVHDQIGVSFRGKLKVNRVSESQGVRVIAFGSTGWDGLRVTQTVNDTLMIHGIEKEDKELVAQELLVLTPQDAGVTSFANQEFELGLDIWTENDKDLKVLVYVNGVRTTKMAVKWQAALTHNYMYNGLYGIADEDSIEIMPKEHAPQGLTKIGWKDFEITESQTTFSYSDGEAGLLKKQNSNLTTLMDTSFRGVISFNNSAEGATELFYGDTQVGQQGIHIIPSKESLTFERVDKTPYQMATISATEVQRLSQVLDSEFTFGSFLNREFELGIDLWQESESLKMNVFINGIQVIPTVSMRKATVSSDFTGNGITFVMKSGDDSIAVELPLPEEDFCNLKQTPDGYPLAGGHSYVRVNDEASVGDSLTTVGDYHVLYVDAAGVTATDVGCYKPGDAHVDDKFDLRDVVAVAKVVANQNVSSIARKKAADVNESGEYDSADRTAIYALIKERR